MRTQNRTRLKTKARPETRITIRPATEADASSLASVQRTAAASAYEQLLGPEGFSEWARKRCSEEFQLQRIRSSGLLLAEVAGEPKALGFVRPEDLDGDPGGVYLGDFYVSEPAKGLGSALLSELTFHARRMGSYLWTLVFESNTPARDFFEARGFEVVGVLPNAEAPSQRLLVYRRSFPASYRLLAPNGEFYDSPTPGVLGGWRGSGRDRKIYGRLDCPSALRHIRRGGYVDRRVFFASEEHAVAAGFRPCASCLPDDYADWKTRQQSA